MVQPVQAHYGMESGCLCSEPDQPLFNVAAFLPWHFVGLCAHGCHQKLGRPVLLHGHLDIMRNRLHGQDPCASVGMVRMSMSYK